MKRQKNVDFTKNILEECDVYTHSYGNCYLESLYNGNAEHFRIGSRVCDGFLRSRARKEDIKLTSEHLKSLNEELEAEAHYLNQSISLDVRVGYENDSIVSYVANLENTRIIIKNAVYDVVHNGNHTPFYTSSSIEPLCLPDREMPILDFFSSLFNLNEMDMLLLLAWTTYVMVHPKGRNTTYPILSFKSPQGAGKTSACKILRNIIDPRSVGIQKLPNKIDDFALMAESSHLLIIDNIRRLTADQADTMCMTSTGGTRSKRKLYSDSDEVIHNLQVALILNGIHAYIDQPDLAERCLNLNLKPIPPEERKTEQELTDQFEKMQPRLMAGLFDLAAKTLHKLPKAEPCSPERMMNFCKWLAAMELALKECNTKLFDKVPLGTIQKAYSVSLHKSALDNLQENELGAAILDFATCVGSWSGTPTELLNKLNNLFENEYSRSKKWPLTPISLSKQVKPLVTALASQGVFVEFTRGSTRKISIQYIE